MQWLKVGLLGLIALISGVMLRIHLAARRPQAIDLPRDVAIVLGTAVSGNHPSPVFETRIRHGIWLLENGRVQQLLFTGGLGTDQRLAEAEVACRFALAHGIARDRILCETRSTTTMENLVEAAVVMRNHGLTSAYLVSDPLHLQRGMQMAQRIASMNIAPAPTPFSPHNKIHSYLVYLLYEGICTIADGISRNLAFLPSAEARPAISHTIHALSRHQPVVQSRHSAI